MTAMPCSHFSLRVRLYQHDVLAAHRIYLKQPCSALPGTSTDCKCSCKRQPESLMINALGRCGGHH